MIRDHHNEIALDNVLGPFLLLGRFPHKSLVSRFTNLAECTASRFAIY